MGKGFYIETFGCQMNVYDSNTVRNLLLNYGFREVKRIEDADIVIVNTCTVREKADIKALEYIKWVKSKGKRVLVMGCMAQWMGEKLLNYSVDLVVGTQSITKIPDLLMDGELKERVYCQNLDDFEPEQYIEPGTPFAFLTIMRGCDHFCSFCIVPKVRGREISRPHGDILEDAKKLQEKGVIHLTLLGQNVNSYFDGEADFPELLKLLDEKTNFLWIKYTSPHPRDVTPKLIKVVENSTRISNWVHLPLQAGSTQILKRMNRGYTKEEYIEKALTIREVLKEGAITTDIMVGFPGETEKDFEDTLDVVKKVEFDGAYMFIFSPRPGTPAYFFKDQIPHHIKNARLRKLIEVVNEGIRRRRERLINRVLDVLVDKPARKSKGFSSGVTKNNTRIVVEGIYPKGTLVRGKVVEIKGLTPIMKPLRVFQYQELCLLTTR